jgi:hypothetical protein
VPGPSDLAHVFLSAQAKSSQVLWVRQLDAGVSPGNGMTSESGDIGLAENSTEMNGVEGIVDGRLEECTMEAETIWIWTHCVLRSANRSIRYFMHLC